MHTDSPTMPMVQIQMVIRIIRDKTNDEMMRPSLEFCQPSSHVSESVKIKLAVMFKVLTRQGFTEELGLGVEI